MNSTVVTTRSSLQELIKMSKDERFRKVVKSLEIGSPFLNNHSRGSLCVEAISTSEIAKKKQIVEVIKTTPSHDNLLRTDKFQAAFHPEFLA